MAEAPHATEHRHRRRRRRASTRHWLDSGRNDRQILIYSFALVLVSMLAWMLGFAGIIYGVAAAICGAMHILLALQLGWSSEADGRVVYRLLAFSIVYLFVLFAALLLANGSHRWSFPLSARGAPIARGSMQVPTKSYPDRAQHGEFEREHDAVAGSDEFTRIDDRPSLERFQVNRVR